MRKEKITLEEIKMMSKVTWRFRKYYAKKDGIENGYNTKITFKRQLY